MPTINVIEKTPDHDPDEYLEKFILLVIKFAPKYDNFSLTDVKDKMGLPKEDRLIFRSLTFKLGKYLVDNEFANREGYNLILTERGRDLKDGKEKIFGIIINNDFSNSTIGQVNQSSSFSNSPQTNNITANNVNPSNKNLIMKFWKLITENKLVSGIILIIIIYLIKKYFGIDLKG